MRLCGAASLGSKKFRTFTRRDEVYNLYRVFKTIITAELTDMSSLDHHMISLLEVDIISWLLVHDVDNDDKMILYINYGLV